MKRVVEVPVDDESLAITYDRDAFVRASADAAPSVFLSTARSPYAAESRANVEVLAAAIVSWDLLDDDGRACALDREFLSTLPIHLLYSITQAIEADVFTSEDD